MFWELALGQVTVLFFWGMSIEFFADEMTDLYVETGASLRDKPNIPQGPSE